VEISRLRTEHVRERFDSGVPPLDEFLRQFARQNDEKGLSRTYVATRPGEFEVLGYVTIRVGEVACADLPPDTQRGLPRYPVPVLHVARLAVDKRARGIGLGEALLVHALRKALDTAEEVGVWGVEVIAKDEAARSFYRRYGFEPLVDDQLHLYVSVKTVRKAFP
jgi:ribosomal protein S18 acetylase RimI-like enzyme